MRFVYVIGWDGVLAMVSGKKRTGGIVWRRGILWVFGGQEVRYIAPIKIKREEAHFLLLEKGQRNGGSGSNAFFFLGVGGVSFLLYII